MPSPYIATMPHAPWHRRPENPFVIVDTTDRDIAAVEPIAGDPAASHATMSVVAQAIAALPDVIDAARLGLTMLDLLYPGWTDQSILEESQDGDTFIAARNALRAALRRTDGLMPDGSIPPPGYLP